MMLTPAAPSAGPTGGDGFAAPPLTCNLTTCLLLLPLFQFNLRISEWKLGNQFI